MRPFLFVTEMMFCSVGVTVRTNGIEAARDAARGRVMALIMLEAMILQSRARSLLLHVQAGCAYGVASFTSGVREAGAHGRNSRRVRRRLHVIRRGPFSAALHSL